MLRYVKLCYGAFKLGECAITAALVCGMNQNKMKKRETDQITRNEEYQTLARTPSLYKPLRSFHLAKGEQKHYQQQYADMYFARLAVLKPAVERIASEAWEGFEVSSLNQ